MELLGKKVFIGGKERVIALDLNALITYARITGDEITKGLSRIEDRKLPLVEKFETLRLLLYSALVSFQRWAPENLNDDLATVGNWLQPANFMKMMDAIMQQANEANESNEFDGQLAPFVPSPAAVVEAAIELADIRENDVFLDLGAGDGRLLVAAAEKHPTVKAIGYEAHLERYRGIKALIKERKLGAQIAVHNAEIMQAAGDDIAEATIVFLYLLQGTTNRLFEHFRSRFKPGTKVITHDFTLDSLKPEKTVSVTTESGTPHVLASYIVTAMEESQSV